MVAPVALDRLSALGNQLSGAAGVAGGKAKILEKNPDDVGF